MSVIRPFTYRPPAELHKRLRDEAWKRHLSVQRLMDMMLTAQLDYWDMLMTAEVTGQPAKLMGNGLYHREEDNDDTSE